MPAKGRDKKISRMSKAFDKICSALHLSLSPSNLPTASSSPPSPPSLSSLSSPASPPSPPAAAPGCFLHLDSTSSAAAARFFQASHNTRKVEKIQKRVTKWFAKSEFLHKAHWRKYLLRKLLVSASLAQEDYETACRLLLIQIGSENLLYPPHSFFRCSSFIQYELTLRKLKVQNHHKAAVETLEGFVQASRMDLQELRDLLILYGFGMTLPISDVSMPHVPNIHSTTPP